MPPSERAALRGEPSYVWRSGQERRLQMVARYVRLNNAVILDAGCGVGMYASQFRRRFSPQVEAFELEVDRVKEAQQGIPHALIAVNEHLPYPSNHFDLVFSNEVIEHVQDDRASAAEMVRVTRPSGKIVIVCPKR